MKKRFVILVDFSAYSANLLRYAYDWSIRTDAEILLVHQTIVLTPGLADHEQKAGMKETTNRKALDQLKNLASEILPLTARVQFHVSDAHLHLTLTKLLSEPFNNLIFVGLKGTGLFKQLFIGSVALQVIENSENLVVAMPQEISTFHPQKIFVAVSDKHQFNVLVLNKFFEFIETGIEQVTFFYLTGKKGDNADVERQLSDLAILFANKFNTQYQIYDGENSYGNIKAVINNKIDELLVIQKGSRLLTDRLFGKFLINELVYEGQTPLVVLPN